MPFLLRNIDPKNYTFQLKIQIYNPYRKKNKEETLLLSKQPVKKNILISDIDNLQNTS